MSTHLDWRKHEPRVFSSEGGSKWLLCRVKRKMVRDTPEERIRQAMLNFLVDDKNVPADMIELEDASPALEGRKGGRADIVIYRLDEREEQLPVCLVECKRRGEPLTDDVVDQADRYAASKGIDLVALTNGDGLDVYLFREAGCCYDPLEAFPFYEEMTDTARLKLDTAEPLNWTMPHLDELARPDVIREFAEHVGHCVIGQDTTCPELRRFAMNVAHCIYDSTCSLAPQESNGIHITDRGLSLRAPGNRYGGSWSGQYRWFLVKGFALANRETEVGVAVMASQKTVDDPKWGTRKGSTMLLVAVRRDLKVHNSLQLRLDTFVAPVESSYRVWHDGTLTMGRKGRAKNEDVLRFVETRAHHLLGPDHLIELGVLDNSRLIRWEQEQTTCFLGNLITYALVRDEYRSKRA